MDHVWLNHCWTHVWGWIKVTHSQSLNTRVLYSTNAITEMLLALTHLMTAFSTLS